MHWPSACAELPTHDGLASAASGVAAAARQAERGFARHEKPAEPAPFASCVSGCRDCFLAVWIYWRFFYVATLTLALPDRDASQLRDALGGRRRVELRLVEVPGSREAVEQVAAGQVDLAFVQGGLEIPRNLPRLETPSPELVLWLTRNRAKHPREVKKILTSLAGEGSHSVAQALLSAWRSDRQVEFVHDWRKLTTEPRRPNRR